MAGLEEWKGTFEIWQDQKFGKVYARDTNKLKLFLDNMQVFVSRKPLIGNTSLYVYCPPQDGEEWIKDLLSLARMLRVGRIWIYTIEEVPTFRQFVQQEAFTFILDLTLTKEEIWKKLKKGLRNEIRRAKKKGVIVREAKTSEDFDNWYGIYNTTASAKGFGSQPYDLVRDLFKRADLSKLFITLVENKIVGGMFFLTGNYPMYWLSGFDREYRHLNVGALNMYEAVLRFKNTGYRLLDLGGAVLNREHGPTFFKKKFGGEVKEASIYEVPVNRVKAGLLLLGEVLQKAHTHTPVIWRVKHWL